MSDVLFNNSPTAGADKSPAAGTAEWLGGLLDMARNREDAALAKLIAGVIDDLNGAARG